MAARPRLTALIVWAGLIALVGGGVTIARLTDRAPLRDLLPDGVLRVGMDASYPPFAAFDGTDFYGIEVEIGRALAAELGVTLQIVNLGFDGLYDALLTNRVDVLISALVYDSARTDRVIYSPPYYDAGLVLAFGTNDLATRFEMHGWQAFHGHAVAFAYGSDAHAALIGQVDHVIPGLLLPYELPSHALDAVHLGAAQAAVVSSVDLQTYPHELHASASIAPRPYVMAINRQRGDLAAWLIAALERLRADGRLAILTAAR